MDEGSIGLIAAVAIGVVAIAALALLRGRKPGANAMSKDLEVAEVGGEWKIDKKNAKESKIEFPKGEKDIKVKFKLTDDTAEKYKFNRNDPIWVHENYNEECPPEFSTNRQIEVKDCDDNELKIVNTNEDPSTLRYQLNLLDKNNNPVVCDPEFKNGGK